MAKTTKKTDPETTPTPEATPTSETASTPKKFQPYQATVTTALAVLRRTPDKADKPVTTLTQGAKVHITESRNGYGKMDNGLWIKEAYLDRD